MSSNPLVGPPAPPAGIPSSSSLAPIDQNIKEYNKELVKYAQKVIGEVISLWDSGAKEEGKAGRFALGEIVKATEILKEVRTGANTLIDYSDIQTLFNQAKEQMIKAQETMSDKVKPKVDKAIKALGDGKAMKAHQVMDRFRNNLHAALKDNIEQFKMEPEAEQRFYESFCNKLLEINKELDTIDKKGKEPDLEKFAQKALEAGMKLFKKDKDVVETAIKKAKGESTAISSPTRSPITSREPSVTSRKRSEEEDEKIPPPPPPEIEDNGEIPPPPPHEGVTQKVDPRKFFSTLTNKIYDWLKEPKGLIKKMTSMSVQIKHVLSDLPIDRSVLKDLHELKSALTKMQDVISKLKPVKSEENRVKLFNEALQKEVNVITTKIDSLEEFEMAERKGNVVSPSEVENKLKELITQKNNAKSAKAKEAVSDHVLMLSKDGTKVTIAVLTADQKGYLTTESPLKDLQKSLRLLNKEIHFPSSVDTLQFSTGQKFERFYFEETGPRRKRSPSMPLDFVPPKPPAPPKK